MIGLIGTKVDNRTTTHGGDGGIDGATARLRVLASMVALTFCITGSASAMSMIDFESVPGSSPADKLAITNQYNAIAGATFAVDRNGDGLVDTSDEALGSVVPYLEAMGEDADGTDGYLNNDVLIFDQEAPSFAGQNGNYYLRFDQTFGNDVHDEMALIIFFDQPITAASGQIWDVEPLSNNEFWRVSVYGSEFLSVGNAATAIDSIETPSIDEFDGGAWDWSFEEQGIFAIELRYAAKQTLTGIGFDNFQFVVPEPASALLLGMGLVLMATTGRARRTH
jgi:hypothetical protein